MLVLHTWPTTKAEEIPILLEELGLSSNTQFVALNRGEQFEQDFFAMSTNDKIPALVDERWMRKLGTQSAVHRRMAIQAPKGVQQ